MLLKLVKYGENLGRLPDSPDGKFHEAAYTCIAVLNDDVTPVFNAFNGALLILFEDVRLGDCLASENGEVLVDGDILVGHWYATVEDLEASFVA